MNNDVWIWDTWPLTNRQSKPISYKGWSVIFSLTAPRSIPFGDRHWHARIGYFYSRDARHWTYGGQLFPGPIRYGSREWAGSTVLTGDEVHVFYTASGGDNAPIGERNNPLQRIATASGRIHADNRGVWFTGLRNNKIILRADGDMYQTLEQSQAGPIIYAFRDPFVFTDPADGETYMLFEANTAGTAATTSARRRTSAISRPVTSCRPSRAFTRATSASPERSARTSGAGSCCRRCCPPTARTSRPSARTW